MHAAGAFNKPCVVIAGGREPYTWEAYTKDNWRATIGTEPPADMVEHKFLHTLGRLVCCTPNACWKSHLGESDKPHKNCHHHMKTEAGKPMPACLGLITVDQVVSAVRSYLTPKADLSCLKLNESTLSQTPIIAVKPPEVPAPAPAPVAVPQDKLTICVLMYGNFEGLHHRVIEGIVKNTDKSKYRLIAGCNEVCQPTLNWLPGYLSGVDHEIMVEPKNIYKYPFMRKMFEKVTTPWVLWFDDDSSVSDPAWLPQLMSFIAAAPAEKVHCVGHKYYAAINHLTENWIKAASWYKGKTIQFRGEQRVLTFATGGWWAASMEAIRKVNWPDPRLKHNGGDATFGEALRQNDMLTKNIRVVGVKVNDARRRGYSESYPSLEACPTAPTAV
jgi:hypothetical protein